MRRIKPKDGEVFIIKSLRVDLHKWFRVQEYYKKRGINMSSVIRRFIRNEDERITDEMS